MVRNCTILINSSDKYCDTWMPFFKLFKKNWPDCPYPIILNTESMSYCDQKLEVKCLNIYRPNEKSDYGERLLRHLSEIKTEYVIMLLDDFFLRSQVRTEKLEFLIDEMDKHPDIATFSFEAINDSDNIDDGVYGDYVLRNQCCEWKFNLQGALWRKDVLVSLIKPHENPWDLERMGTIRAFDCADKFYALKKQEQSPIDYGKKSGLTWGIVRGKWVESSVVDLFRENGIEVDFQERGFLQPEDLKNNHGREKIDFLKMLKSLGATGTLDLLLWRGGRFIRSRTGMRYYSSYTDYRGAKLKNKAIHG